MNIIIDSPSKRVIAYNAKALKSSILGASTTNAARRANTP